LQNPGQVLWDVTVGGKVVGLAAVEVAERGGVSLVINSLLALSSLV